MTTSRRLQPLAALAMVALIGAGCSNGSADHATTGAGNGTAHHEKAVKFAECMRHNGVSEFPDPDASGELTIDGVMNGSSLDPNAPSWKEAIAACKDLEPPGFTGGGERSPDQQKAALKFAQCMRENGVKDFPDPVNGQPLVDTRRIPSAAGNGIQAVNAAMQICRDLGAAARGGQ